MKFYIVKNPVFRLAICALIFASCTKDIETDSLSPNDLAEASSASAAHPLGPKWETLSKKLREKNASLQKTDEYYKYLFSHLDNTNSTSDCSATSLDAIIEDYKKNWEFWDYIMFPDYAAINRISSIIDQSKQFFGRNGEHTNLVVKQQRRLEEFWNMRGKIRINGQHSETLDNRDKVAAAMIIYSNASTQDAYYIADLIIEMNAESKVFPESPLLSFDVFATSPGLIVIGDGLIDALNHTGIDDDIVVSGLVSHEWGHQVQFSNFKKWYGVSVGNQPMTPEFTRQIELEADFLSGYFLTHKRGAAYNWKRVAAFNQLFFNIGDCDFKSTGHHGTPVQRRNASQLGYKLANETLPMGKILTAEQLHAIFIKQFRNLL